MTIISAPKARGPWLPGLDGLRALAVVAVVIYHFTPGLLPGGFLGVDLFFAISGYLITRLLINQINEHGHLDVIDFYRRRIRRLAPVLVAVIGVVVIADQLFWRDELATLRASATSGIFFVANWWLIGDNQSYFVATGRPSMLQHLWSLAIEEQFYLIWPLILGLVLTPRLLRRGSSITVLRPRPLTRLAFVAIALALASTAAMAILAVRRDIPYGSDSSRVYFGTDTHSMGLLLGSALGAYSSRSVLPGARRRGLLRGAFLTDVLALVALAFLVRASLSLNEYDPGLYRGGFLLLSLAAAVLVSAVARRGSLIGWLLERPPLIWLGRRSYSIYLWHWPVAVVTRPNVDVSWPSLPLFAGRVLVTLALAELSYRFIELPVRTGVFTRFVERLLASGRGRMIRRRIVPAMAFLSLLTVSSLSSSRAYSSPTAATGVTRLTATTAVTPAPPPALGTSPATSSTITVPAPPTALPPTTVPTPTTAPVEQAAAPPPLVAVPPSVVAATTRAVGAVSAFGDSVMLGATRQLGSTIPGMNVHAVEGRQARAVFADIGAERVAGTLAVDVVIHTGDNGIVSPADLAATIGQLGDRARVVVVTDRVAKDWQDPNNAQIRRMAQLYPNVVIADWFAAAGTHIDWFYKDGLHLKPAGATQYAALINAALTS